MSFVTASVRGPAGKTSSADASPAGEPPIQFAASENRGDALPVQTCVDGHAAGAKQHKASEKRTASARVFMDEARTSEVCAVIPAHTSSRPQTLRYGVNSPS